MRERVADYTISQLAFYRFLASGDSNPDSP